MQCVPPVLQVKESHGRGELLPRPEPLPLWGGDDTGRGQAARGGCRGLFWPQLHFGLQRFFPKPGFSGSCFSHWNEAWAHRFPENSNNNNHCFCVGWLKCTMCCTRAPEELCHGMRRNKSIMVNPLSKPSAMLYRQPAVWAELSLLPGRCTGTGDMGTMQQGATLLFTLSHFCFGDFVSLGNAVFFWLVLVLF